MSQETCSNAYNGGLSVHWQSCICIVTEQVGSTPPYSDMLDDLPVTWTLLQLLELSLNKDDLKTISSPFLLHEQKKVSSQKHWKKILVMSVFQKLLKSLFMLPGNEVDLNQDKYKKAHW